MKSTIMVGWVGHEIHIRVGGMGWVWFCQGGRDIGDSLSVDMRPYGCFTCFYCKIQNTGTLTLFSLRAFVTSFIVKLRSLTLNSSCKRKEFSLINQKPCSDQKYFKTSQLETITINNVPILWPVLTN